MRLTQVLEARHINPPEAIQLRVNHTDDEDGHYWTSSDVITFSEDKPSMEAGGCFYSATDEAQKVDLETGLNLMAKALQGGPHDYHGESPLDRWYLDNVQEFVNLVKGKGTFYYNEHEDYGYNYFHTLTFIR